MLKQLAQFIYDALVKDIENKASHLVWNQIDLIHDPEYVDSEGKATIIIKGDDGGKDYRVTIEEI